LEGLVKKEVLQEVKDNAKYAENQVYLLDKEYPKLIYDSLGDGASLVKTEVLCKYLKSQVPSIAPLTKDYVDNYKINFTVFGSYENEAPRNISELSKEQFDIFENLLKSSNGLEEISSQDRDGFESLNFFDRQIEIRALFKKHIDANKEGVKDLSDKLSKKDLAEEDIDLLMKEKAAKEQEQKLMEDRS